MRTMLRVEMEVVASNQAITDGMLPKVLQTLIQAIHPEASYFFADHGKRTALFVFDMRDSSQIPQIVEPLFEQFNASIDIKPVMNLEELQKGLSTLKHQQPKTETAVEMA